MCPRKLVLENGQPTLLKCCLLEFDIEAAGQMAVVPWGADLKMVEEALRTLVSHQSSDVSHQSAPLSAEGC
jgi:hypothetical protein